MDHCCETSPEIRLGQCGARNERHRAKARKQGIGDMLRKTVREEALRRD